MKKQKLTEEHKYILRAAKLKGLAAVEIEALRKHFTGEAPNDFVIRRNPDLFELLEKKKAEKEGFIRQKKKVIRRNVIVSKTSSEEPGSSRIITPSLTSYILKPVTYMDDSSKFHSLARKNELILPFVARKLGVDAAVFLEVDVEYDKGEIKKRHITKNLIKEGEEFISGNQILNKDKDKKTPKVISMTSLLDKTDKYVKKFCKKEKISEEVAEQMRASIRQGLIKQTFINKFVLNDNEENWGLINYNKALSLSPMYGFEQAAGVIVSKSEVPTRRVVGKIGKFMGKEDIQSFMLTFGKEAWFRSWITNSLKKFNIQDVFEEAQNTAGITLSEDEKEYYSIVLNKTLSLAREVIDVNFDENKIGRLSLFKNRPQKIRKKIEKEVR